MGIGSRRPISLSFSLSFSYASFLTQTIFFQGWKGICNINVAKPIITSIAKCHIYHHIVRPPAGRSLLIKRHRPRLTPKPGSWGPNTYTCVVVVLCNDKPSSGIGLLKSTSCFIEISTTIVRKRFLQLVNSCFGNTNVCFVQCSRFW